MRAFTRQQYLALRPETYLADGYLAPDGTPHAALLSDYATAAATQLLAAETSPQELALTFEGIRQLLPLQEGPAPERLLAAIDEALMVVARAIQQENNPGLTEWLAACAAAVTSQADLDAFMAHAQATMRLYGVLVATQP